MFYQNTTSEIKYDYMIPVTTKMPSEIKNIPQAMSIISTSSRHNSQSFASPNNSTLKRNKQPHSTVHKTNTEKSLTNYNKKGIQNSTISLRIGKSKKTEAVNNNKKSKLDLINYPTEYFSGFNLKSTSFSSKGYGNGFLSTSPRFTSRNESTYNPCCCDYNPAKTKTIMHKIRHSPFGKSFFMSKINQSILGADAPTPGPCTYFADEFEETMNLMNSSDKSENKNANGEKIIRTMKDLPIISIYRSLVKPSFFFKSNCDRFRNNEHDKNMEGSPEPASYFNDINYKIKSKEKNTPCFVKEAIKEQTAEDRYGINAHSKNNKKVKWYGRVYNNSLNKNKISDGEVKSLIDKSLSNKKLLESKNSLLSDYKININDKETNNSEPYKERINFSKVFKRKDLFELAPKRWDDGTFHNNESHFQTPGPAYYFPKKQLAKVSFNKNSKDFICCRSSSNNSKMH